MKSIIFSLAVLSIPFVSFTQGDSSNLKYWNSQLAPNNTDTLAHYNWSNNNWVVFINGDNVHARLMEEMTSINEPPFKIKPLDEKERLKMRGKRSVLKVEDGYLVAFWRGEFGGVLYWFAENGKERKFVSFAMIVQFIQRDNKIYAIEGLAHLSMSDGSIVEIKKVNKEWKILEYLKLPFAPYATQLDANKNMIVVTSDNLLSVNRLGSVDTLVKEGFWSSLYPTSMVIHKNICYVGMRQGVLKFDLFTKKQEWLMP